MVKSKEVNIDVRKLIIEDRKKGSSYNKLADKFKISKSTVRGIVKKFQKTKTVLNEQRSGRPRKLKGRALRKVVRIVKHDPKSTARGICGELQALNVNISKRTVQRHLNGYEARRPVYKPYLKPAHKKSHLLYARTYVDKPQDFFNKILWSDESKIELMPKNGPRYVWRQQGDALNEKCLIPTV